MPWRESLLEVSHRLGSVLLHPREAFEEMISEGPRLALPLAVCFALAFSSGALAISAILGLLPPLAFLIPVAGPAAGLISAVLTLIFLLLLSVLIHANALLLGGSGDFEAILAVLAYSQAPDFLPVAALAVSAILGGIPGLSWFLLGAALGLLSGLWGLWIAVVGTGVSYGLSSGKALIAAFLIPLALFVVVGISLGFGAWWVVALIVLGYAVAFIVRERGGLPSPEPVPAAQVEEGGGDEVEL